MIPLKNINEKSTSQLKFGKHTPVIAAITITLVVHTQNGEINVATIRSFLLELLLASKMAGTVQPKPVINVTTDLPLIPKCHSNLSNKIDVLAKKPVCCKILKHIYKITIGIKNGKTMKNPLIKPSKHNEVHQSGEFHLMNEGLIHCTKTISLNHALN